MRPLGIKPIRRNFPAIDNLAWGKRALSGENSVFYAMDYDLPIGRGNKKADRQQARRDIAMALHD